MKLRLYTIKDTLTGEMIMPFTEKNDKSMIRGATIMANSDKNNYLTENAQDKQIWRLGTFDNETGEIKPKTEFICNAIDLQTKEK